MTQQIEELLDTLLVKLEEHGVDIQAFATYVDENGNTKALEAGSGNILSRRCMVRDWLIEQEGE